MNSRRKMLFLNLKIKNFKEIFGKRFCLNIHFQSQLKIYDSSVTKSRFFFNIFTVFVNIYLLSYIYYYNIYICVYVYFYEKYKPKWSINIIYIINKDEMIMSIKISPKTPPKTPK